MHSWRHTYYWYSFSLFWRDSCRDRYMADSYYPPCDWRRGRSDPPRARFVPLLVDEFAVGLVPNQVIAKRNFQLIFFSPSSSLPLFLWCCKRRSLFSSAVLHFAANLSVVIWVLPCGSCEIRITELVVVVVVVAFSSHARILGECSAIHSPPALFLFCFFVCLFFFSKWRLARAN